MNEMISTIKRFSPTQGEIYVNKNVIYYKNNSKYDLSSIFVCVYLYIFSKGR